MADPRKPGRPRVDERDESANLHLTIPARQYDDLYKRARIERTSVQELIRRKLLDPSHPDR